MKDKGNPFGRIPPQPPRPPMVALDRFNNQIEAGHLILFHAGEDLIFEVVSVGPVLNPSIQGGQAIQVTIAAQFPVMFQPAMSNRTMVICGETKARIEAKAARNGGGQPDISVAPSAVPPEFPSGIVPTDAGVDDGGPGDEGAPRDLGDTSQTPSDDDEG